MAAKVAVLVVVQLVSTRTAEAVVVKVLMVLLEER
jgi:hypothetical protein